MRFRIEDESAPLDRVTRSVEQIEVLQRLGEEEALHLVLLLFAADVGERGVGLGRAAPADERVEVVLTHVQVEGVAGEVVKGVGGLDDLRDRAWRAGCSRACPVRCRTASTSGSWSAVELRRGAGRRPGPVPRERKR